MQTARHDAELHSMPQRMHLSSQMMEEQMAKAGVPKSNMRVAFGGLLPPPVPSQDKFSDSAVHSDSTSSGSLGEGTHAAIGTEGLADSSVSDTKAMGKIGHIDASTKARAQAAVAALMKNPHAQFGGAEEHQGSLKISVYPGSSRPLRAKLSPTSIAFWKKLDDAGVNVRPS